MLAIAGQITHHAPQRIDAGQHGEQLVSFLVCQRCATWPGCLGFAASHLSDVAFQQEATVVDKAQPTTDGPRVSSPISAGNLSRSVINVAIACSTTA
jgi:hypothetical protein